MRRLLPEPAAATDVDGQLAGFDPPALCSSEDRPYTYTNFAVSVDGHATIDGRSGAIGSAVDTEMLVGLRTRAEAVMIGAGTMRAERYGRIFSDPARRAAREKRGLPADPLVVLVSASLDLPWDADLFTDGAGRVLVFTASEQEPPTTATPLQVVRHREGVDLVEAMRCLRVEHGVRGLLCEGGPRLHAALLGAGLVDEAFVTVGPQIVGGNGPSMTAGLTEHSLGLELAWLLAEGSELFARYRVLGT